MLNPKQQEAKKNLYEGLRRLIVQARSAGLSAQTILSEVGLAIDEGEKIYQAQRRESAA